MISSGRNFLGIISTAIVDIVKRIARHLNLFEIARKERQKETKMADKEMAGWVNPLALLEVDEPWASIMKTTPTCETLLKFLCPADEPLDLNNLISRYRQISAEPVRLSLAPAERRVLDKLVWPLRHAKASYMVGNYLATIALSGMIAEMVSILHWKMAESEINGRKMTTEDEKALFGSSFEKMGQERRVNILSTYGLINSDGNSQFDVIRNTVASIYTYGLRTMTNFRQTPSNATMLLYH